MLVVTLYVNVHNSHVYASEDWEDIFNVFPYTTSHITRSWTNTISNYIQDVKIEYLGSTNIDNLTSYSLVGNGICFVNITSYIITLSNTYFNLRYGQTILLETTVKPKDTIDQNVIVSLKVYIYKIVIGDITRDDIVDIYDGTAIGSSWGMNSTSQSWNSINDINNDGVIDIYDGTYIGKHFGETL